MSEFFLRSFTYEATVASTETEPFNNTLDRIHALYAVMGGEQHVYPTSPYIGGWPWEGRIAREEGQESSCAIFVSPLDSEGRRVETAYAATLRFSSDAGRLTGAHQDSWSSYTPTDWEANLASNIKRSLDSALRIAQDAHLDWLKGRRSPGQKTEAADNMKASADIVRELIQYAEWSPSTSRGSVGGIPEFNRKRTLTLGGITIQEIQTGRENRQSSLWRSLLGKRPVQGIQWGTTELTCESGATSLSITSFVHLYDRTIAARTESYISPDELTWEKDFLDLLRNAQQEHSKTLRVSEP